jgi:HlyD family secretion protein
MKRIIAIVGVIAILAVAGFFGYQQFLAPVEPTPTLEIDQSAQLALSEVVSAEGFVVPDREVDLAFQAGGQVAEVLVSEGDAVQAEQVLSRLDSTDQQMVVAQAKSGVAQAEAGVGQARAALASAQAQLAQVKAGPTAEAIAQAEAGVQTAQARLNQLVAGARPEDIQSTAANLLKVQAALRQAQAAYDEIAWAGDVGDKPQAIALEQATLDYEAAQAQYERLVNGPTAEEIAVARAGITEAEAALATVKAGPTREQIAVAEAGVAQAEAGVAEAEAALAAAQAALEMAQAALDNFELVASFPGTVARVNVEVGQFLAPGAPAITLGDASTWYVETDDLSEVDVVQVAIGQPVKVTVDALPDREFQGTVTDIAPRSETKRGDVTYTVSIKLTDATDAPLRWGMTAFVDINVE